MYSNMPSYRFAPPVTLNLIIITALVWLSQLLLPRIGIDLVELLGMHYFEAESFAPYQLLTYIFLHSEASIEHLFFNMLSVWIFGSVIERYWGGRRYLVYYLLTGLTAAIAQQAVWYTSLHEMATIAPHDLLPLLREYGLPPTLTAGALLNEYVTIGASGSVFGILLAFGMLFPNASMFLMFIPIPIKAKYMVVLYGVVELMYGVHGTGDGVAHFAHLGGMIGGIILILLWRSKGEIARDPYN